MSNMTDKPTGSDNARTDRLPVTASATDPLPVTASPTDPLPVTASPSGAPARGKGGGFVPGVAGVVLCVLWIMGIGMVVAQLVSVQQDRPGPGALAVGAHVAAAVVGVVGYRAVSRNRGLPRLLGLLVLLAMTVALLWFFWWSPAR